MRPSAQRCEQGDEGERQSLSDGATWRRRTASPDRGLSAPGVRQTHLSLDLYVPLTRTAHSTASCAAAAHPRSAATAPLSKPPLRAASSRRSPTRPRPVPALLVAVLDASIAGASTADLARRTGRGAAEQAGARTLGLDAERARRTHSAQCSAARPRAPTGAPSAPCGAALARRSADSRPRSRLESCRVPCEQTARLSSSSRGPVCSSTAQVRRRRRRARELERSVAAA